MELLTFESLCNLNVNLIGALGEFDGIHLGHQKLFDKCNDLKKEKGYKSVLISFEPHPFKLFNQSISNFILSTLNSKLELLKNSSFDYFLVLDFDESFSKLTPFDFVNKYLINLNIKELVVGFDFKFGVNGSGNASEIYELSNHLINVHIIDEVKINNHKISSSYIRELFNNGEFDYAVKLLNHPYIFSSLVIKGSGLGHTFGYPTINLDYNDEFINLPIGVYAVKVLYNNIYYDGLMNVGHNPTYNFQEKLRYEIHLLNFNQSIYNEIVLVRVLKFLRNEIKFNNPDELNRQIKDDIKNIDKNISKYELESNNSY